MVAHRETVSGTFQQTLTLQKLATASWSLESMHVLKKSRVRAAGMRTDLFRRSWSCSIGTAIRTIRFGSHALQLQICSDFGPLNLGNWLASYMLIVWTDQGVIWPRVAEIALVGGLECGGFLVQVCWVRYFCRCNYR
jgi:hypothetical protein